MTITLAIIGLLSAIAPFAIWLWKRKVEKKDDPQQQNKDRYAQIDKDIAKRDSVAATQHGSDDLDLLSRLQNNSKRHSDS